MNIIKNASLVKPPFFLVCLCVVITSVLVGCATEEQSPSELYKGQTAAQLYNAGERALSRHDYKSAVKYYQGLDALYPFGIYAERTHLHIIYAYHMDKDEASAEAAALRFIRLYPRSEHVDYAYYMKGITNFQPDRGTLAAFIPIDESKRALGEAQRSYKDFAALVHQFPDSVYAEDARQRMVYLRNLMAAYEYHVARFYFNHKAYVAAANRAQLIVHHYSQAPAVIPALGIMVQSYDALRMPKEKEMALKILALNFPESTTYQAVKSQQ
ncbi:MAG: outer membrane protein assembly factor BamD [Gammaproteobacteria bacterium]